MQHAYLARADSLLAARQLNNSTSASVRVHACLMARKDTTRACGNVLPAHVKTCFLAKAQDSAAFLPAEKPDASQTRKHSQNDTNRPHLATNSGELERDSSFCPTCPAPACCSRRRQEQGAERRYAGEKRVPRRRYIGKERKHAHTQSRESGRTRRNECRAGGKKQKTSFALSAKTLGMPPAECLDGLFAGAASLVLSPSSPKD